MGDCYPFQIYNTGLLCFPPSFTTIYSLVCAHGEAVKWVQSPTPIFHLLQSITETKGFISQSYHMLLTEYLKAYPMKVLSQWEEDLGSLTGDQWEEAFQSVTTCFHNVSQKVSQLYILLRVYYTPHKTL